METRQIRKSIRLPGYDYSRAGAYFVSICTKDRKCLFGKIVNQEMVLNDAGRMVKKWYAELENKFAEYLILYQQMRQQEQEQGCLTEDQIYCILWEHYQFAKGNNLTYTFGCFDPS